MISAAPEAAIGLYADGEHVVLALVPGPWVGGIFVLIEPVAAVALPAA